MNFNFVPITAASCLTSITISFLLCMISSEKQEVDIIEYDNIIKKISFNILGCIISPFLSERLGRKRAIMIIDVLFLFSLICSVFKYEEFARWLLSLAIGISKPATPLFIAEKTRRNHTYCCIFLYNICIPTGVFVNYIITLYLNKVKRCLLILCFVFCFYNKSLFVICADSGLCIWIFMHNFALFNCI